MVLNDEDFERAAKEWDSQWISEFNLLENWNPKKQIQSFAKSDEEIQSKKKALKNLQSVGPSPARINNDAPTFLEQIEAEVNQVMNAY